MSPRIRVWLDDRPFELVVGSRIRDLIDLLPVEVREAIASGAAWLEDEGGNEVGSAGDLWDGQRLAVRQR